jgi:hypothetical protein
MQHIIAGAGLGTPLRHAGVPSGGTSEVQTLTIGGTPTGGTFTLTYDGFTTGAITWSATNATLLANILAALEALPNISVGDVALAATTLTAGIGALTITFGGNLIKLAVPTISATSSLTGTLPTVAVVETTPGVTGTHRGIAKGGLVIDTANAELYQNLGVPPNVAYVKVADQ